MRHLSQGHIARHLYPYPGFFPKGGPFASFRPSRCLARPRPLTGGS